VCANRKSSKIRVAGILAGVRALIGRQGMSVPADRVSGNVCVCVWCGARGGACADRVSGNVCVSAHRMSGNMFVCVCDVV